MTSQGKCHKAWNFPIVFYSLLHVGLWEKHLGTDIFTGNIDWKNLLLYSNEQTVASIVFDGVRRLEGVKCDKRTLMEWISLTNRIEARNILLNKALRYFIDKYHERGIEPVVFKGQCIAQCYTYPLHRHPGDIDFLLPNGYNEANEIVAKLPNAKESEATVHHKSYNIGGVCVENHCSIIHFYNSKNQKAWEKVLRLLDGRMYETIVIECGDGQRVDVRTFSPQLNAIYLFLHLQHHLLQTGIGLRQVCDWACLWKAREADIDKELFLKMLDILPVRRCMTALTWIVEEHLGLDKGIIPLDASGDQARRDGEFLLDDIMSGGNFGKGFGFMDGFKRNDHLNNIRTYTLALKRMLKVRRLCPSEVDAYIKYWIKERLIFKKHTSERLTMSV